MTDAAAPVPSRRRRWRHLLWVLPLLCAGAGGLRVCAYEVPVHRFVADGTVPAALGGATHVHSLRSDGRGSADEIAEEAARAGLHFVVLADHNVSPEAPRFASGVLLLGGTEVTTRDGHLLALDYTGEPPAVGSPAHEAVARVRQAGGFAVAAHGHDPKAPWQRWDLGRLQGLEIYNAATDARRHLRFPFLSLLGAALAFPLDGDVALLLLHARPARELEQLDALGRLRNVVALCGLDAHGLPSYERLFRAMRMYIPAAALPSGGPTSEPGAAARQVWDALRTGRAYCGVELLGDASRFEFHAERPGARYEMGATVPAGAPVTFHARVGVTPADRLELVLFRDGEAVARGSGGRLEHTATKRGVYRVEVTLPVPRFFGGDERRSWIYSNPIYVRRNAAGLRSPGTTASPGPPSTQGAQLPLQDLARGVAR